LAVALLCIAGCTREQVYGAGQARQRQECIRIPDKADYERCMRDADRSYDTYRRETGAEPK
jgi:hypothetical protein